MSRLLLVILLLAGGVRAAEPTGVLKVRVFDHQQTKHRNPKVLPVRAWVDAGGERHFQPQAPTSATPYAKDRSFSCEGEFTMVLPTGKATLYVEKGKEWVARKVPVEIRSGQTNELSVNIHRWINMPKQGWFSADLHVHFGHDQPKILRQLALADDVHVVPAFSTWLRGTESAWPQSWPKWEGGPVLRIDEHHLITRDNLEIERINGRAQPGATVGATFLYNLKRPVSAARFDTRFPTDATLTLQARLHSPQLVADTDKPSWGETAVGAALGVYDTAQLCHNHYHRDVTLKGGWGMIGPLAQDEKPLADPDELFRRTNRQYYHWLNCGIQMAVSGGSAMGVMKVPLGYNRTYALIDGELTAEQFWSAVRKGRTFATSGPMIDLRIGTHRIGDRFNVTSGTKLNAEVTVQWTNKLDRIEIIHNGASIELPWRGGSIGDSNYAGEPDNQIPKFKASWSGAVNMTRSGWFAGRVIYQAPDGRLRQAHTSPIYVSVDKRPTANRESAEYNQRWIDRLIAIARLPGRYQRTADRDQVIATYTRAREFYERVARIAVMEWGD